MNKEVQKLNYKKELGNVVFERNNELNYTHFSVKHSLMDSTEIYISDEVINSGVALKKLKNFVATEIERVKRDPFGGTNIDPHVEIQKSIEYPRAINRFLGEICAVVGQPIAIKRSGLGEDMIDQYLFMRELHFAAEKSLTKEQKAIIEFLPVYGAVSLKDEDFLFMKYIKGAREIADTEIPFRSYGWPGSGDPYTELAFPIAKHRNLVRALGFSDSNKLLRWRDVAQTFKNNLGISLYDLAGRNVLEYQSAKARKYVIIDQVRGDNRS